MPFVISNLVKYKLHNTSSIPKQFVRNVRHHTQHKHHAPASQNLSLNKSIQCLISVTTFPISLPLIEAR